MDSDLPPELPAIPPTEAAAGPALEPVKPWGFWATTGLGMLIGLGYMAAQTGAAILFILCEGGLKTLRRLDLEAFMSNGKLIALTVLVSTPVVIALCVGAAYLRKGISFKEYFALRWPPRRVALRWIVAFVVYLVAVDVALMFLKSDATEKFMANVLHTAGWAKPLLWVAVAIGAPLSEEFFFRGFLFVGWRNSWLGAPGAVIVTALLFASIHLQYDVQGVLFVLLAGLFFGVARWKTDSLWLCVTLHSVMNIIATVAQSLQ
jgi:membrane protease YdiL (CAAX protease family)